MTTKSIPEASGQVNPGAVAAASIDPALAAAIGGLATKKVAMLVLHGYRPGTKVCTCGKGANCEHPGKHPRTAHGLKDATDDAAEIRKLFEKWPNSHLGAVPGSGGFVVADHDTGEKGDEEGRAERMATARASRAPLAAMCDGTFSYQTPSGGGHSWFKLPAGTIVRSGNNKLGKFIDVKSSKGYAVFWVAHGYPSNRQPIQPAPAQLIKLLNGATHTTGTGKFDRARAAAGVPEGDRQETLFKLACSARARRIPIEQAKAEVGAAAANCTPPFTADTDALVERAYATYTEPEEFQSFLNFTSIEQVRDRLEQLDAQSKDITRFYAADYIKAAAALEHFGPAEFAGLATKLKGKQVAISRWESAVHKTARQERERLAEAKKSARLAEAPPATRHPPQWATPDAIATAPVDGKLLLDELTAALKKFVMLEGEAPLVVALWILFTWVFEQVAETNPFLRVVSPVKNCGKSTLLKVLKHLTRSGWLISRLTGSAFTRTLAEGRRTLLLDEGDAFLRENEVMRNLLDGAADPDTANVSMSVPTADGGWEPVEFNGFVPIVIASIGRLYKFETVESRAVHVRMKRATKADRQHLTKARRRLLGPALAPLAEKCARWAADNAGRLVGAYPAMPDEIEDGRDLDKWELLIAIADAIDAPTGQAARAAAIAACGGGAETNDLAELLLADIRGLFKNVDRYHSKTFCTKLADLEGRPWAEYGRRRIPISQNQLARLLANFGISSTAILIGKDTAKGYYRKDFRDAFARYAHFDEAVELERSDDKEAPSMDSEASRSARAPHETPLQRAQRLEELDKALNPNNEDM